MPCAAAMDMTHLGGLRSSLSAGAKGEVGVGTHFGPGDLAWDDSSEVWPEAVAGTVGSTGAVVGATFERTSAGALTSA